MAASFTAYLQKTYPFDTIRNLEAAAEERFWDGLQLATAPRHETAAIYLLGYVAEMLVKAAYYRFRGIAPTSDVSRPGRVLNGLSVTWPRKKPNYHEIDVWVDLLVDERKLSPNPMDPVMAGLLRFHVSTVLSHWRETLRYIPAQAGSDAVDEVYASIEWLRKHYPVL